MSVEELSAKYGMPLEQAVLAKKREYDEPFEILDPVCERLLESIERRKKRWTRGGRSYHILGANDKVHCVRLLIYFYERIFGKVTSVGLGDGLNDARLLRAVDIPIVLESADSARLQAKIRKARFVDLPGPEGWNRGIGTPARPFRLIDKTAVTTSRRHGWPARTCQSCVQIGCK
jgi:mannosyl-3-phosphoglycerate phosphatase